jgi:hypothetical protein
MKKTATRGNHFIYNAFYIIVSRGVEPERGLTHSEEWRRLAPEVFDISFSGREV